MVQYWGHSLLTILGLGLGVSVFISIHLSVAACLASFRDTARAVSGSAQWQIRQDGLGLEDTVFPKVKTHPLVRSAAPVVELQVPLRDHPGEVLWIMGLDVFNEGGIREQAPALTSVRERGLLDLLLVPKAIAVNRDWAERLGLRTGSKLAVGINGRREELQVVALLEAAGPTRALSGRLGVMDIAQAQEVLGRVGRLDRIDLTLNGDGPEDLRGLEKILPAGVRLERPGDRRAGTERMIRSYQLNLLALSFIAVLVSLYLIYQVTSLSVVRRQKEWGVLRSLGMLPSQIRWLILGESAVYGLAGGLLGIGGGLLIARLIVQSIARTISDLYVLVGTAEIRFHPGEIPLFLLMSVAAAMGSAALPARQAARLQPREILGRGAGSLAPARTSPARSLGAGTGLLLMSALFLLIPPWRGLPLGGLAATLGLVLGFSLILAPLTRKGVSALLGRVFPRMRKPGAMRLGVLYFTHSLDRMAVSMAALMTAVAMLISVAVMIRSFRQTVDTWIDQSISGDLLVGPVFPSHQGDFQFLGPAALRRLESLPEVRDIYYYRGLFITVAGHPARLWSGNLAVIQRYGGLAFTAGDGDAIFRETLTREGVLVSEVLANRLKIGPGGTISLPTARGPQAFRVAGVFYDYRTEGGGIWMDRAVFLKWWGDERINGVRLYLKDPAAAAQVRQRLLSETPEKGSLVVVSHRELRNQILTIFDQTFQVTYALEAIAILVAFLGIIHTSSILNLFRTRELGILKALGALPGQIRTVLLTETVLMGFFSYCWGALAGSLLSLILIFVINKQSFGWTIRFYWGLPVYVQTLVIMLISSILAGWVPAALALKFRVQQMIREE